MTETLMLRIDGFSELEDHGKKEDGTDDIRVNRGYRIQLVWNHQRIVYEETLPRDSVPVDPTEYLVRRISEALRRSLPQIDPRL